MSESREQRQKALEERRKRIADLRETRHRREVDTARVQSSVMTTANLEDYVSDLLKEPAPVVASVEDIVTTTTSATTEEESSAPPEASSVAAVSVSNNIPVIPTPAIATPKAETFDFGTQTEEEFVVVSEEEHDPPDHGNRETFEDTEGNTSPAAVPLNDNDPKFLSNDQLQKEVATKPFSDFLNTTSKKVERLLGTPLLSEWLVDHVGQVPTTGTTSNTSSSDTPKDERQFLSHRQVYECPKWTSGRDMTHVDWSPWHRDGVLATYDRRGARGSTSSSSSIALSAVTPHDTPSNSLTPRSGELQSDGLALIWNLAMPQRPEHIFTCASPVTTGCFHPTEPPLVVGGCESGQVVVWDVRAGRLPVQKSTLVVVVSAASHKVKGHAHPIHAMAVLEGGAGMVTSSSDGKINFWSLSNLREPAESMQVGENVSCLALSPETGALVLGDDHGRLYTAGGARRRHIQALECADDNDTGHYGMVTALSMPQGKKGVTTGPPSKDGFLRGLGGLVLSAGVDWTVKLWAPAYRDTPLTSWVSHSYDYMSDVQWSPVHPTLFATGSSHGRLGLWNLAVSLDEPLTGADGIVVEEAAGIHKLSWSLDGRRLAVASSDRLHVVSVTEEVLRNRQAEEDSKRVLQQFMTRGWMTDTGRSLSSSSSS